MRNLQLNRNSFVSVEIHSIDVDLITLRFVLTRLTLKISALKVIFFSFDVTPLFCRCFLFQAIRELILFHTEDRTLCMCNIWFRTVSYSSWIALVKRALWLSVLQPKPKSCTDNEISNRRENTKNQVVIGWKGWRKFLRPITGRSKAKTNQSRIAFVT